MSAPTAKGTAVNRPLSDASVDRLACLLRHWTWAEEAMARFDQELAAGWDDDDDDPMSDHPSGSYYTGAPCCARSAKPCFRSGRRARSIHWTSDRGEDDGETNDLDRAFEHLERALDARDPALIHLAVAPLWDGLRADPRFNECLGRMKLRPVGTVSVPMPESH